MLKVRIEEPREMRVRVGSQISFVCSATSKVKLVALTTRLFCHLILLFPFKTLLLKKLLMTLHFFCQMPAFVVMWTKRGGGFPRSRVIEHNGILYIHNVQLSDTGIYVCIGSNMYSEDRQTARLTVVRGQLAMTFDPTFVHLIGQSTSILFSSKFLNQHLSSVLAFIV